MPSSAKVLSSFPPAGTVTDFSGSPFISIRTSPLLTSRERAKRITITSNMTIAVNKATPPMIVVISIIVYFILYSETPLSDIKPKDIKPTVTKVIPSPLRPAGTSLYFSFSRIPARATIASAQPNPEPRPKATLSENE